MTLHLPRPTALPEPSCRAVPPPAAGRVLDSAVLLGRQKEVTIRHREETYRLRETRQGKLILTK